VIEREREREREGKGKRVDERRKKEKLIGEIIGRVKEYVRERERETKKEKGVGIEPTHAHTQR
jgi:hypothetical protein